MSADGTGSLDFFRLDLVDGLRVVAEPRLAAGSFLGRGAFKTDGTMDGCSGGTTDGTGCGSLSAGRLSIPSEVVSFASSIT